MSFLSLLHKELKKYTNYEKAKFLQRFFKTGEDQYAVGDIFIGLTVPESRKIAKQFVQLPLEDTQKLLISPIHEQRLIALLILIAQFTKASSPEWFCLPAVVLQHKTKEGKPFRNIS